MANEAACRSGADQRESVPVAATSRWPRATESRHLVTSGTPLDPTVRTADAGLRWATLYRIGGACAGVYVVLVLVPIVLLFVAPVPPVESAALLTYIADHRAVYLTELICFVGLAVPALGVFVAVATALWNTAPPVAALGGLLGVVSETIALALGSSPQSLHGGLVVLSNCYATAGTDAERAELTAAARALIAATNAVSWAGILTAAAILVLSSIMARTQFGRFLAVLGVLTGVVGIVSEALRPLMGPWYLLYGLLLPTWFALVGWKLLRHVTTAGS